MGCGVALCEACRSNSVRGRSVCSEKCAGLVDNTDEAWSMVAAKMLRTNKVNAWFSWTAGAAFVISGMAFYQDMPGLSYFCFGLGAVLVLSGFWYSQVARKST
jgi:hypothetical protein